MHIIFQKGWCNMEDSRKITNTYDDGDIPQIDLPQDLYPETIPNRNIPAEMPPQMYPLEMPEDVIPDEVPRRDGPGGEPEMN